MYYLLRRKIRLFLVPLVLVFVGISDIQAQMLNQEDHDDKPYHFGINLGYNVSNFIITHHRNFLASDSIMDVESKNNPGINLALLANLRLSNRFDIRFHPVDITFSEKAFVYQQHYEPDTSVTKKVQSVSLAFPLNLAFSSDRIGNFKVYTFAGGRLDYDLSSNKNAENAEDMIKLKRTNLSAELGLGFHVYFPWFVLSPEIKLTQGITNLHSRDPYLKYSNVIDRLYSRVFTFSLTVE